MAEIIINNLQKKIEVSDRLKEIIKSIINTTITMENISNNGEVSVIFVDNNYIQKLNKKYRKKDVPTDVLSFPVDENYKNKLEGFDLFDEEPIGDIVVSLEKAKEQAKDYNHSFEREVGYLVVHGMLHLLGFDHLHEEDAKLMRKKEEAVLAKVNLKRGKPV